MSSVFGLKVTPRTAIDLQGGVAVAGNLRLEDDDGDRIRDDDYDAAPFIALKGQIFFMGLSASDGANFHGSLFSF